MTTLHATFRSPRRSILRWLGIRRTGARDGGDGERPSLEERRQLMNAISLFLLDHELEISEANLVLAHRIHAGGDARLMRKLGARLQSGGTVTDEWLGEITADEEPVLDSGALEALIARLETDLEAFSRSTKAARTATTHYNSQLEQHVSDLEQTHETGQIISHLADLAKAMLERTRKVEGEMRRSEEEARSLRKRLAQAKRDAEIDHLTGLPNRRAFEALLERNYQDAKAAQDPLCVAFCDIDHFKRINDQHGHDAGDRVIKAIGQALAAISDQNCHVARHGGEEFVMLFRGLQLADAKERLEETKEDLAMRKFINRKTDKPFGTITFSGGIADVFAYADVREALKAADEALYAAKEAGRDRIHFAQRATSAPHPVHLTCG